MFSFTQTVQFIPDPGQETEGTPPDKVTNRQVAEVLFNIATLLEMQQANPYRIQAYRNAARGMLALPEQAQAILARGEVLTFPGLGERLRRKIGELITTGHMTFYDDLCEESLPDDVRSLMAVPFVGPRTALRLSGQIDIHSVEDLLEAAEAHKLRKHYRFGPRSEARLAEGARAELLARSLSQQDVLTVEGSAEPEPGHAPAAA
jgi:DNA polymerase/3'-5' exonuclease PolX